MEDEEQLGGKLSDEQKQTILDIVTEKLDWLRGNEGASAEEFNSAKKEIEDIANPIIAELYKTQKQSESEEL